MSESPPLDWREPGSAFDLMRTALGRCRFASGTWDKKFARSIVAMPLETITEAQRWHTIRMARRYRRQMPPMLVPSKDAFEAAEARRLARTG